MADPRARQKKRPTKRKVAEGRERTSQYNRDPQPWWDLYRGDPKQNLWCVRNVHVIVPLKWIQFINAAVNIILGGQYNYSSL